MKARLTHVVHLESDGHAMVRNMVCESGVADFRAEAARLATALPGQAHGIRDLLRRSPVLEAWAQSSTIRECLPPGMQPVRAILFDKSPEANWKVAWHQDLTIAVQERMDVQGYGPWSVKMGTVHVQPPLALLEGMITLRLHLDDTPSENGALKVIPRTHCKGRLGAGAIAAARKEAQEQSCEASAGDILLMKPLLLHASSPSMKPGHRRVVHIEYAHLDELHPVLRWAER